MASIYASNSIYGQLTASNKGIGGLASGLDTDSIVEALTMSTRTKIAKQLQQKTLLNWKMTAYRSVRNTLYNFQSKFFSGAGGVNNLKSFAFFNTFKATSSSDAVTVKPQSGSALGSFTLDSVKQLATAQSFTTNEIKSELVGDEFELGGDYIGKTLQLTMNGSTKTVKLDELDGIGDSGAFADKLQELINKSFGTLKDAANHDIPIIGVSLDETLDDASNGTGKFKLTLDGGANTVTVANNADGLGLAAKMSNRLSMTSTLGELMQKLDPGYVYDKDAETPKSFQFSINGTTITMDENTTITSMMSKINTSTAGVSVAFSEVTEQFTFTSKVTGAGNNLDMYDITGSFLNNLVGARGSSKLTSTNTTPIAVTGFTQSVTGDDAFDLDAVKNIREQFDLSDTPTDTTSLTYKMNMTLNGNTEEIGVTLTSDMINELRPTDTELSDEELNEKWNKAIQSKIVTELNDAATDAFGSKADVVAFKLTSEGKVSLQAQDLGQSFGLSALDDTALGGAEDLFATLKLGDGTSPLQNELKEGNTKLSDLGVADGTTGTVTINFGNRVINAAYDEDTTVTELVSYINSEAGANIITLDSGKLTINGGSLNLSFTDDAGDAGVMKALFGTATFTPVDSNNTKGTMKAGQNAVIEYKGQLISSTTNSFQVNGVDFEVNKATVNETDPTVTINVASNPDDLIERVKGFVNEYNALVETLYTALREGKSEGYEPLTDEQKAEMTEEQIKMWETEAKKGILRSDPTISKIMENMRTALYQNVEAAGLSLHEIGITTESYSATNSGKLEINETKLRNAIEQNPDAVRTLFNHVEYDEDGKVNAKTSGLAYKLDSIINDAVRTDSTNQGSLVRLAGTEALTGNNESDLSKKIASIDEQVTKLKARLEAEYNRYWKKFSALESAIQQMSTQSGWLESFGASQ